MKKNLIRGFPLDLELGRTGGTGCDTGMGRTGGDEVVKTDTEIGV